ncbi:hypothetical protein [Thiohalomonas denitrificans]|uniref:Uncharacterized protein n=1 Tax=Thiohalomonas denitrificans TaxID=415747 RepID=A0A1G5QD14_9GAMM|nr:hypothetical protein [Thiohalomonas denitrificans]SCZ59476.1 hypothetical protein SAMN03097708_01867 [Thiohalomonas denitrificans]
MLEYLFFDESIRDRFGEFLKTKGVEYRFSDKNGLIAMVPEELSEELDAAIDEQYEKLLQETAELLEDEVIEHSAAGVRVQLSDGTPCQVRIDPDLFARMLGCITLEELRELVQDIALAVENPDDESICHTPDGKKS